MTLIECDRRGGWPASRNRLQRAQSPSLAAQLPPPACLVGFDVQVGHGKDRQSGRSGLATLEQVSENLLDFGSPPALNVTQHGCG